MEHPITGKKAAEPLPDSVHRITAVTSSRHFGTDFTTYRKAETVFAVKEGVVVSNSTSASNSGAATITVENTDGSISRYLHVGSPRQTGYGLMVGEPLGKTLLPGQIGYGTTNTGAHLHYEQYLDHVRFTARKFMSTSEVIDQWKN